MTTVREIEAAIAELPREQFAELAEWFDRQRETDFDPQTEADANAGRFVSVRITEHWECFRRIRCGGSGSPCSTDRLRHRRSKRRYFFDETRSTLGLAVVVKSMLSLHSIPTLLANHL